MRTCKVQGRHRTEARDCSATVFVEHVRQWNLGGEQLGKPAHHRDPRTQDPCEVADDINMRVETLISQCCTHDVVRTKSAHLTATMTMTMTMTMSHVITPLFDLLPVLVEGLEVFEVKEVHAQLLRLLAQFQTLTWSDHTDGCPGRGRLRVPVRKREREHSHDRQRLS